MELKGHFSKCEQSTRRTGKSFNFKETLRIFYNEDKRNLNMKWKICNLAEKFTLSEPKMLPRTSHGNNEQMKGDRV